MFFYEGERKPLESGCKISYTNAVRFLQIDQMSTTQIAKYFECRDDFTEENLVP